MTVSVQKQLLDAQQRLDGDHRRQKNDLTEFVEASVSFKHMIKRGEVKEGDKSRSEFGSGRLSQQLSLYRCSIAILNQDLIDY